MAKALLRRVSGRPVWIPKGPYVTFETDGFVAAPSPALLLARHNYETGYIDAALHGSRASKSLEIGCGFGRLAPVIAKHSDSHVGIDINHNALALARSCYRHLGFGGGSVTSLPFRDGVFDLVVTWTVLQHIRPTLIESALAELVRVLSPAGRLLVCEATCFPGAPSMHTWDRERSFYEEAFAPRSMVYHSYIEELSSIPGLATPGEVMLFAP